MLGVWGGECYVWQNVKSLKDLKDLSNHTMYVVWVSPQYLDLPDFYKDDHTIYKKQL